MDYDRQSRRLSDFVAGKVVAEFPKYKIRECHGCGVELSPSIFFEHITCTIWIGRYVSTLRFDDPPVDLEGRKGFELIKGRVRDDVNAKIQSIAEMPLCQIRDYFDDILEKKRFFTTEIESSIQIPSERWHYVRKDGSFDMVPLGKTQKGRRSQSLNETPSPGHMTADSVPGWGAW